MTSEPSQSGYDGRVLIPKEPLDLPVGARVQVSLHLPEQVSHRLNRLRALWEYFEQHPVEAPTLDDEALRRENLYEERPWKRADCS